MDLEEKTSEKESPSLRLNNPAEGLQKHLSRKVTYLLTPWSRVLLEKLTVNYAASQEGLCSMG
jgi:hypothetical protein